MQTAAKKQDMSEDPHVNRRNSRGQQYPANPNQNQNQNQNLSQSRQTNQQRQTPFRERGAINLSRSQDVGGQALTAMSGNAWINNDRNREGSQHGSSQEQQVPIKGFNAQEMREALRKGDPTPDDRPCFNLICAEGYSGLINSDSNALGYKAPTSSTSSSKPPWGSKRTMK
ncbi:MAG: hypothetical protein Q9167_004608 [Letrouitia subvulpina]